MNYSTNYNLNKPERSEQFNIDHWNNNTDAIDTQMHINKVNIAQNATDIATLFTGLNTKNTSDTNSVFYKLMKLIYPVGSLYWSSKSTNPANLFGGTWTQIKDKFIWAKGDSDTVNATGGEKTHTLTVTEMPSHNHGYKPSGTVSSHSHGLNNHTHSFSGSGTTGNESAHEKFSWSGSHGHGFLGLPSKSFDNVEKAFAPDYYNAGNRDYNLIPSVGRFSSKYNNVSYYNQTALISYKLKQDIIQQSTISISGTCTGDHTHSFSYSGTTGGSSGDTTSVQPTFTGTTATTGNKGDSEAHNNMPPYIVKYCWERVS